MEALTQSLRLETVGSGVKVTSIQPGMGTVEPLHPGDLGDRGKWMGREGCDMSPVSFRGCNIFYFKICLLLLTNM